MTDPCLSVIVYGMMNSSHVGAFGCVRLCRHSFLPEKGADNLLS